MSDSNQRFEQWFFLIALGIAGVLAFSVLRPYLDALLLAGVLAISFAPLQRRLTSWFGGQRGLAAFLGVVAVLLIVFVPLLLMATLLFGEATDFYRRHLADGSSASLLALQGWLQSALPPGANLDLAGYLRQALAFLIGNLGNVLSGLAQGGLFTFIVALSLYYLFKDGPRLREMALRISPLSDRHDAAVIAKLRSAVNSIVLGSLAVALIQAILTWIGLAVFGVPNAALWGALAVLAALIPSVGTGLITAPAVLYLLLTQHWGAAIGLAIWSGLLVGLVDNLLRPKLLEQGIHIHPLLILLSVLGGLSVFGPIGFFVGPLTLSLLFALLEIFNEDYQGYLKGRV